MNEQFTIIGYTAYIVISVGLCIWVARTLHRNGRVFLVDAFHQNEQLADSVNHLLVVGFYLINIGYISMALKFGTRPLSTAEVIELLSWKIGVVLLILGFMHFFNIFVFNRMRAKGVEQKRWLEVAAPGDNHKNIAADLLARRAQEASGT